MNRFKSVFLLSKFMVLFISNVSFVWFTFQCGFVFFSSSMGTSGIEVEKKKVEIYIWGLVPSSMLVVFLFCFPFFFLLLFSFSPFLCFHAN
jgi:hypothetical protein